MFFAVDGADRRGGVTSNLPGVGKRTVPGQGACFQRKVDLFSNDR